MKIRRTPDTSTSDSVGLAYDSNPRSYHSHGFGAYLATPRITLKMSESVVSPTDSLQQFVNKPIQVMQATSNQDSRNPLEGLVSDDVYQTLESHHLLSEKGVRDYQIRQRFRDMRNADMPAYDAIEALRDEYPYLQFDTIRKIVYRLNGRK